MTDETIDPNAGTGVADAVATPEPAPEAPATTAEAPAPEVPVVEAPVEAAEPAATDPVSETPAAAISNADEYSITATAKLHADTTSLILAARAEGVDLIAFIKAKLGQL